MKRRKSKTRRRKSALCPYTGSKSMPVMAKSIDSKTGLKKVKLPKRVSYKSSMPKTRKWF